MFKSLNQFKSKVWVEVQAEKSSILPCNRAICIWLPSLPLSERRYCVTLCVRVCVRRGAAKVGMHYA